MEKEESDERVVFESVIATSFPRQIFSAGWKVEQREESMEKKEAKEAIINVAQGCTIEASRIAR